MNAPSSLSRILAIALFGLAAASLVRAAEVEAIVAPPKRADVLDQARKLLAPKSATVQVANPFYTTGFGEVLAGASADRAAAADAAAQAPADGGATPRVDPAAPKSGRDLLQAIAAGLRPRYVELGGQPMLFFGQKRVKAGGILTITFEGKEYTLEVPAIDRTNFTLRLNREEFTRPIK